MFPGEHSEKALPRRATIGRIIHVELNTWMMIEKRKGFARLLEPLFQSTAHSVPAHTVERGPATGWIGESAHGVEHPLVAEVKAVGNVEF